LGFWHCVGVSLKSYAFIASPLLYFDLAAYYAMNCFAEFWLAIAIGSLLSLLNISCLLVPLSVFSFGSYGQ